MGLRVEAEFLGLRCLGSVLRLKATLYLLRLDGVAARLVILDLRLILYALLICILVGRNDLLAVYS